MKNKKLISIMMTIITILLIIITTGIISNTVIMEEVRKSSIHQIAKSSNQLNDEYIENASQNSQNLAQENNEAQLINTQNIQELRTESLYDNETISSRSGVERQDEIVEDEEIHIKLQETEEQDYQEIIQYTKIEDVKISFDMDVSKTTGLSKEDFIYLVQNMKYDKTGILEKNAGWIWECCKKYSVNEIFVLGICGIESGWCSASQHQNTHNYSSLMSHGKLISYASDEAGFEAMIKLLGQKYLTPGASLYHGATITGVGQCYCNTTTWPKKVYTCMQQVFQ